MKPIIVILFTLLCCSASVIQAQESTTRTSTTVDIRFERVDGVQRVALDSEGTMAVLNIVDLRIVSISIHSSTGKVVDLRPSASTPRDNSCPCGYNCWEDDVAQQSICECKPCSGGGPGTRFEILSWSF